MLKFLLYNFFSLMCTQGDPQRIGDAAAVDGARVGQNDMTVVNFNQYFFSSQLLKHWREFSYILGALLHYYYNNSCQCTCITKT